MADYKLFLKNDLELVSENMAVSSFKNKYGNYVSKQKKIYIYVYTTQKLLYENNNNPELRGNVPICPMPTHEQSINR